MSTRTLQLKDLSINRYRHNGNSLSIYFEKAIIIKNMDAADENTLWYGDGVITIESLFDDDFELPECPISLSGADIRNNQMTYRNEIIIPVNFHGHVGISMRFCNTSAQVSIYGERMSIELIGHEKYIEHIKAE